MLHAGREIFEASFALVPTFAIARAIRKGGSPCLKAARLDFGGDAAVIAAFGAAFPQATRPARGGSAPKPA